MFYTDEDNGDTLLNGFDVSSDGMIREKRSSDLIMPISENTSIRPGDFPVEVWLHLARFTWCPCIFWSKITQI